jgi:hypothetical protein
MTLRIPEWMARPAVVLAALAALAGTAAMFWAAVTGDYWWAVWGGVAFVCAAALWYLGDLAAAPLRPGLE